jgi:cytochrome c biogenesis protein CcmG, thiol:disulfide interchange protein DsbE
MDTLKQKAVTTLVAAGIALLFYSFLMPQYRQGEASPAGRPALDFTFQADGKAQRLSDLHGKVVVLNFWATWCPPCVEETPALNRLQAHITGQGGVVLGISVDEDAAAYQKFLQDYSVAFPTWRDPSGQAAASYGTKMYPETYVIDRQGKLLRKIIGPQDWDSPEMFAYFDGVLAGKS